MIVLLMSKVTIVLTSILLISGEVTWVREMIHKYHEQAKEKKVKIVHCCGYDSVPADLGTFYVVDYVRKTYNT